MAQGQGHGGVPGTWARASRRGARWWRARKSAVVREKPDTRVTAVSVLAARLSRRAQSGIRDEGDLPD
eukprot:5907685-Prymnesium_polylepis.1